jgi:hypothetical protein
MNVIYQNIKQKGLLNKLFGLLMLLATSNSISAQAKLSVGCISGTADLSGITAANLPANTTLTWHSGTPVSTANKISNTTALSPGTYYAAFFDATNSCYSSTETTVTVTTALCINNICPSAVVDLNSAISVGNLPSNTVVSWHTSMPATVANKVADPTMIATSGTYYAVFYDAANDCYSGNGNAATEVIVTINTCFPDSDGDGITDNNDLDDDNDGILDAVECPPYSFDLTNFTLLSPYTKSTSCSPGNGIWYDTNPVYAIGSPNSNCFNGPGTITDHTTGSTTTGTIIGIQAGPGSDYLPVFNFTRTVVPNKSYQLSLAAMIWEREDGVVVDNRGEIQVFINGVLSNTFQGGSSLAFGVWEEFTIPINSGANTSINVEIKIRRGALVYGNDYMFDDIVFSAVNPNDELIMCDTDNDGIPNSLDLDSDNDGINDVIESEGTDSNQDGRADGSSSIDGIPSSAGTGTTLIDYDNDTRFDPYDLDADNDGINDLVESGNVLLIDANGDGIVDGTDSDNDGILGAADGTPNAYGDSNDPIPVDTDTSGGPNYKDEDSDDDGLTDLAESGILNVPTLDANGDGKIDNSADADGDGIPQVVDGAPTVFGDLNNPTLPDGDTDGNPDYVDINNPELNIVATSATKAEGNSGNTAFTFTVTRTINTAVATTVNWTVTGTGGNPANTADFGGSLPSSTVSFAVGEVTKDITINVSGDVTIESDETFTVTLSNPSGGATIGTSTAIGTIQNDDFIDTDNDGVADSADLDDDNDGILDTVEAAQAALDTDGDGVINSLDLDSDNDGINDVLEAGGTDTNEDGFADGTPNATTGIPSSAGTGLTPPDTDGDTRPNPYDLDSDNDGINDLVESGNPLLVDANGDGIVDGTDPDGDGIKGGADGTPTTAGDSNDPIPVDTDTSGGPNYKDEDSDDDGLTDLAESGISNVPTLDANGDGKIDNAADTDNDGIPQVVDGAPTVFGDLNNPTLPDADNNGNPDYTSPTDTDNDGSPDSTDLDDDNDGILDTVENAQAALDTDGDGVPNRLDLDSDNDGINDVLEAGGTDANADGIADGAVGSTPTTLGVPSSAGTGLTPPDSDNDTRPNTYDLDADNDGLSDLVESGNPLLIDADNDGVVDGSDTDNDGIQNSADGALATRGDASDPLPKNTDGTDSPDYADIDSNNNGSPDITESGNGALDANGDGRVDNPSDPDGDGIANNTNPSTGQGLDTKPSVFGGLGKNQGVNLQVKVLLQGAYNAGTGLMRDDLRSKGFLPLSQPYNQTAYSDNAYFGTETTTSGVLAVTGSDAIVDWVLVELRDKNSPTTILATQAGLVQRDGDVVGVDGVSAIVFSANLPTDYYVSVKHRNHLGVMTDVAKALSSTGTVIDFTSTTLGNYKLVGTTGSDFAQKVATNGKRILWASNTQKENSFRRVIYQGPNNDVQPIYINVVTEVANTAFNANYILNGYLRSDVTLDGRTIYQGPSNEVDTVYFEVITHPENANTLANFIITQQIP